MSCTPKEMKHALKAIAAYFETLGSTGNSSEETEGCRDTNSHYYDMMDEKQRKLWDREWRKQERRYKGADKIL